MRRRTYGAVRVNDVDVVNLVQSNPGVKADLGIDVGKFELLAVCRWSDGRFERPWRVRNPTEIPELVRLIQQLRCGRELAVALEPSGTYGDALRQALGDAGVEVRRVNTKAAHDYAEVFDGVPSQHDGKDAAVVAELAAIGKASVWPYQAAGEWDQELSYWVEWMIAQRQMLTMWQGRLEGLVSRYWPEATRVLRLASVTLLRVLEHYGSPQALAADPEAASRLARWGGRYLDANKVKQLVAEARHSSGVRPGTWETRQIRDYAEQALQVRRQGKRGERRLRELAKGHAVLQAQGRQPEAAASYRTTLALNPEHVDAHNNLGTILKDQNALDEAVAHFQTAIRLKRSKPFGMVKLGMPVNIGAPHLPA